MVKSKLFWSVMTGFVAPLSAFAIELTDYTEPDSFYEQAFVNGQLNMKSGNQDQTSFAGTAFGNYDITYSTLPFVWNARFKGDVDFDRGPTEGSSTEKSYSATFHADADKYLQEDGLFLGYGEFDLGYRRQRGADEADDPYAKIGGGVGYGRVINATPLAEVFRFVEELDKYELLSKSLPDSTYLELATIVAKEEEFKSKYGLEDYKLYWIDELEKIMQKSGVLKNGRLGTVGIIKIQDVLINERISIREHGWIGKAGVGFVASNYNGSDSDPSLDASFRYAYPFSHQLQLINFARYSTILEDDITHSLRNTISVTYEVSDKIDWENVWDMDLIIPTEDNAKDLLTNNFSSSFFYHISNVIDAGVSLNLKAVEDDIDDNGNDDLENAVNFSVRYRLR